MLFKKGLTLIILLSFISWSDGEQVRTYFIKKGDCLWNIAQELLNDPFLWKQIWRLNPYIKNPDLIYPGDELKIPSLSQLSLQKVQEAPLPERPEVTPVTPTLPSISEEEVIVEPPQEFKPSLKEKEAEVEEARVFEKSYPLTSYITQSETSIGNILEVKGEKRFISSGDIVYLKLEAPEEINPGSYLVVWKSKGEVYHPVTQILLGELIQEIGVVKITDVSSQSIVGRVILCVEGFQKGEKLKTSFKTKEKIEWKEKLAKEIEGYIIKIEGDERLGMVCKLVYIDRAGRDGVKRGDKFLVFRPQENIEGKTLPPLKIAQIRVIIVTERVSTARVVQLFEPIKVGDRVKLLSREICSGGK